MQQLYSFRWLRFLIVLGISVPSRTLVEGFSKTTRMENAEFDLVFVTAGEIGASKTSPLANGGAQLRTEKL